MNRFATKDAVCVVWLGLSVASVIWGPAWLAFICGFSLGAAALMLKQPGRPG